MVDTTCHAWSVDIRSARTIQVQLAKRVRLVDETRNVTTVAGVDTGFEGEGAIARACIAVFHWPDLVLAETAIGRQPVTFPYVPGYLSFREMPAILEAAEKLSTLPDLLLCDGQGIAHPRRLGIAAHLGVWLDRPAIGVGKSRLCGTHGPVAEEKGATRALYDGDDRIGTVVRTRTKVRPLFVSPGHRVDHGAAVRWVLATVGRYRLPEPIRAADHAASRRIRTSSH
ncbi:deoxyribonuclease V [Aquisalimonas sp.]|uniref:deoxyribonuclease V n=1 Tax=Aquisalimonas sp. TaxID=1872621 RepID=UPI0025BF52E9|nr:deoxyribonuclease V [Aquisalimonas sp.]